MGRLNQARRTNIGYTYCPQVQNNIQAKPCMRNQSIVQLKEFKRDMRGYGLSLAGSGLSLAGSGMHGYGVIDKAKQMKKTALKYWDIIPEDQIKEVHTRIKRKIPRDNRTLNVINNAYERRGDISKVVKTGHRLAKEIKGNGFMEHSKKGTSIQPTVGGALRLAGQRAGALKLAGQGQSAGALKLSGQGLGLAGNGLISEGLIQPLPGDELKKKLLKNMVREKKMKALGDRVKTAPIKQGMNGGSNNISGTSNGQSRSKTLPGMKGYKLNPRPLVGAGAGKISPKVIIGYLVKNVIPMLKKEKLISENMMNNENLKKLIAMKAKKIMMKHKDPQKIIKMLLTGLKPMMNKDMKGQGIGDVINKLGWKLLSGLFKMSGSKHLSKGADYMANYKGEGCCGQDGGFVFTLSAIIAAISSAAAAASAAASSVAAISVAGTTVGALASTAAGTVASAAAGKAIDEINKTMQDKTKRERIKARIMARRARIKGRRQERRAQRGRGMITGQDIKDVAQNVVQETKLTIKDLPAKEKLILLKKYKELKKNPSKEKVIQLAKQMAPVAQKIIMKKAGDKIGQVLGLKKGSGLSLAGGKMKIPMKSKKEFGNKFIKEFSKEIRNV